LAEAARTHLELARVMRQASSRLVPEALLVALDWAERSRRVTLIHTIEAELRKASEAELYRRAYRRARGWGIREDIASLSDVQGEKATILFFDLRNFTGFSLLQDPHTVQVTLNQVFAELAAVVERHHIVVNQYLGDGFMALVREDGHPRRAVRGGLEMLQALEGLNRARRLLGLPLLQARIGVCTGDVVFGNLGTHRKIDFTAVGPTVNQAARVQGEALPNAVCVSQGTYERVKDEVAVKDVDGRQVALKGIGEVRVWDVLTRT
jgi:class 3 adenylate cyclase